LTRPLVYGTIKAVLCTAYRLFFRFRHRGAENVPPATDPRGVILAPNHASYLDPPILGISLKRRVTYLAKEYLFRAPIVGWTLRSIGAYPIRTKTDDFKSIRELIRVLKEGRCVVVFPEGTRSPDGSLRKAEGGVGFLAMKSGAWVVPAYIRGTYDAFPRGRKFFRLRPVSVVYGKAFLPADDPAIAGAADPYGAVGDRIMREIAELKRLAEAEKV
jgi:1-acyl-sn-glycerol-3-phosphate acyltransferase